MTKRIILAVSGSISAYKAADLTSRLKKKGYDVHVIMTEAAQAYHPSDTSSPFEESCSH